MSPGKTTNTKHVNWPARLLHRFALRGATRFALVIGLAALMVATLTGVSAIAASASSKGADHSRGRYTCSFDWGGRYHRYNYRYCRETLIGTVTGVGTNSFMVEPGFHAFPTTTTTASPTTTTTAPTTTTTAATTTTTAATTTTTTAAPVNCSASTSGETQLNESSFLASTNITPSPGEAPQRAITNAVNENYAAGRFSSDKAQAVGDLYEVNMGSAQTFNEIQMAVPGSPTDYATGYNVNVSFNGSTWTTVASCTGTKTPELVSFPTQTAQYLEVVLTAASTTYWWSIDQFFVYNTTPSPTTTTTTVAPSTTTTTVAPSTTTVPVPVSFGLWTVNVFRGTRYIGACPGWRGLGGIAVGDIVTVTGYRAGGFTIDAILVAIRSPYGTSWNYRNCLGWGRKYGHGYGTTTTTTPATTTATAATTTTIAATTTTMGWGYGSHGHRHHGH